MIPKNKAESFFEKLYHRILCKAEYGHIVSWKTDGKLVIYDVRLFEKAIQSEKICERAICYDSIARQLRIYGFNRIPQKASLALVGKKGKVWKHCSLTSTCTRKEVRDYKRRASAKGSTKSRPRKIASNHVGSPFESEICDEVEGDPQPSTLIPLLALPDTTQADFDDEGICGDLADHLIAAYKPASPEMALPPQAEEPEVQTCASPVIQEALAAGLEWLNSTDEGDPSIGSCFDVLFEDTLSVHREMQNLRVEIDNVAQGILELW